MKITPAILSLIASRFRDETKPKINQSQMAELWIPASAVARFKDKKA